MDCPWQSVHIAVLGCGERHRLANRHHEYTDFASGFMGTAILQGLLTKIKHGGKPSIRYTAWVRSRTSLERLRQALGEEQQHVDCVAGGDVVQAMAPADTVILGFPPGELKAVFANNAGLVDALRGKLIISLLAGVSYHQLSTVLQDATATHPDFHTMRVIPSIGARINNSVTLIAENTHAGHEQRLVTTWIFGELGQIQWLPESLMNEATATGAACNALVIVAVDAIVDAGVAEGIPRSEALKLAAACLHSSSALLLNGGMTVESLKEAMSVPKGITINSVLELERGHVRSSISDTVRHAIHYTRNM